MGHKREDACYLARTFEGRNKVVLELRVEHSYEEIYVNELRTYLSRDAKYEELVDFKTIMKELRFQHNISLVIV